MKPKKFLSRPRQGYGLMQQGISLSSFEAHRIRFFSKGIAILCWATRVVKAFTENYMIGGGHEPTASGIHRSNRSPVFTVARQSER